MNWYNRLRGATHGPPSAGNLRQAHFESFFDHAWGIAGKVIGVGMAGSIGLAGLKYIPAAVGAIGGQIATSAGIGFLGLSALGIAPTMYKRMGGMAGMTARAGGIAVGLGQAAISAGTMAERLFRVAFTGGLSNPRTGNWVDSYFPFYKMPYDNVGIRKFAPNPKIARRMTGVIAGYGLVKGLSDEVFNTHAPAPSVFFDGVSIRRMNDMGADAAYGQALIGNGSPFSISRNDIMRTAMYM